ncbi:hypothetical protein [Haloplanus salinarum]|uniref:hypothetical protein n=1 Tax=Haloplanus salinarum TaxID=1912324 RepID=UPI00214BB474|nr:hypothetical protein [Haloplanus salinarum]
MSKSDTGESETNLRNPSLHTDDFERLLSDNYKIFTILSVFAALSVYLFNLSSEIQANYVDWGVAGALFMFMLSVLVLVYKLMYQLANYEEIGIVFRTLTSGILVGLIAVTVGIFSIVSEFFGEVVVLSSFVVVGIIYSAYINWFPWDEFRDLNNVPKNAREKIKEAPSKANLWCVTLLLVFSSFLPSFPKLDGESGYIVIPMIICIVPFHYALSFGIRKWHLSKIQS